MRQIPRLHSGQVINQNQRFGRSAFWNFGKPMTFLKSPWKNFHQKGSLFFMKVLPLPMASRASIILKREHLKILFRDIKQCEVFMFVAKAVGILMVCQWNFKWKENLI